MNVISPKFCLIFSFFIYIVSFFIPSDLFDNLVGEPNVNYLNGLEFFYIIFSLVCLAVGMKLADVLPRKNVGNYENFRLSSSFAIFLLVISVSINSLITINIFNSNKALIISALLYGQSSSSLMTDIDLKGSFSSLTVILSTICLWIYYHSVKFKNKKINTLIFLSLLVSLVKPFLFMNRLGIMSALCSYLSIFILHKYQSGKKRQVYLYCIVFFVLILIIFMVIALLRMNGHDNNPSSAYSNLFGYTLVPYSHFGALLLEKLNYYNPGFGYYLITFMRDFPVFGDFFNNLFSWGDGYTIWLREFQDTWRAGLNGDLIWLTAFGYVFVSLGYFSFIYFLIYGFFVKIIWNSFLRGSDFGVVFYPWVFFCLLFLFGTNVIASKNTLLLFFSFLFIRVLSVISSSKFNEK